MHGITPFLWFDDQAEEAAAFYTAIFPDAAIERVTRYDAAAAAATGQPEGGAMTVAFTLGGQSFTALNGGPQFAFSEAISFVVDCESQAEVDHFWSRLSAGGEQRPCGWLKDRYGVSWQVVPRVLVEMLGDADPGRSQRVMQAMLQMRKIDIASLERAWAGE